MANEKLKLENVNSEVAQRNKNELDTAANINLDSALIPLFKDLGNVYKAPADIPHTVEGKVYDNVPEQQHLKDESLQYNIPEKTKLPKVDIDGKGAPRVDLAEEKIYGSPEPTAKLKDEKIYPETLPKGENPIINQSVY